MKKSSYSDIVKSWEKSSSNCYCHYDKNTDDDDDDNNSYEDYLDYLDRMEDMHMKKKIENLLDIGQTEINLSLDIYIQQYKDHFNKIHGGFDEYDVYDHITNYTDIEYQNENFNSLL